MDMDRYSAPLRVVLNIATLKAYVIHNWAKSEFDLMQMPWRNLGPSEIGFCANPACTVLEVYNLQRTVLGFSHQRSGLGVVLSVSINSAPSKGPDTTLVPWKLTRMEAGTQYPWDSNATSYTPPTGAAR